MRRADLPAQQGFCLERLLTRLLWFALIAVALSLGMQEPAAADAGPARKLNILFIAPFNRDLPAHIAIEDGLDRVIGFRSGARNAFFEFLDSARLPAADTGSWLRALASTKYATIHFDVVVSYAWPAVVSVARNHTAFAGARHLYAGVPGARIGELRDLDASAEIVVTRFDSAEPLRAALALTGASKIYLAGDGRSPIGRDELAEFRRMAAAIPGIVPIDDLSSLRFDDVVARAASLPPGSLIWYLLTFDDGNGGKFHPYDMAARLGRKRLGAGIQPVGIASGHRHRRRPHDQLGTDRRNHRRRDSRHSRARRRQSANHV